VFSGKSLDYRRRQVSALIGASSAASRVACLRRTLFVVAFCLGTAAAMHAQNWGVGATVGLVNDVSVDATFDGFKPSEVTAWADYKMEHNTLLRGTFGWMRTRQTNSENTVTTPDGPLTLPLVKERVNYGLVGVSYLFWEGFYTAGVFGGIGGYHIEPDESENLSPVFDPYLDRNETVFGWHAGMDGDFRIMKHLSLVIRFTYHNVSAHPHRQWVTADTGLVAKF
jgi:Outer membrane protein beta-barrel domain